MSSSLGRVYKCGKNEYVVVAVVVMSVVEDGSSSSSSSSSTTTFLLLLAAPLTSLIECEYNVFRNVDCASHRPWQSPALHGVVNPVGLLLLMMMMM